MSRNPWTWIAAALLCVVIALSYTALHQYNLAEAYKREYENLREELEGLTITINLLIDYGNGTVIWLNETRIPIGADLLMATELIASVDYTVGEYGAFVTSINGVGGDLNRFWIWYYLKEGEWVMGPVACDAWKLHDGDIVAWRYSSFG